MKQIIKNKKIKYFLFLTLIFFFFNNTDFNNTFSLHLVPGNKYTINTPNSWLVGTILNARENGIYSKNLFTTRFIPSDYLREDLNFKFKDKFRYQNDIYLTNVPISKRGIWNTYKSALRLPVTIWVLMDQLYCSLNGECQNLYSTYILIVNLFNSLALALIVLWLYLEFGFIIMICSSFLFLLHPIINHSNLVSPLFWQSIPFIASLYFFRIKFNQSKIHFLQIFGFCFAVIFTRQLLSYEFTPIGVMGLFAPIFYYSVKKNISLIELMKYCTPAAVGTLLAIFCVLGIHFILLSELLNSSDEARDWFSRKFIQRTYSEIGELSNVSPYKDTKGTNTGLLSVLVKYYITDRTYLKLPIIFFAGLQIVLLLITLLFSKFRKLSKNVTNKICAMFILSISLLLGTILYFILFKSQAADHKFPYIYFHNSFYISSILWSILVFVYFLFNKENKKTIL